MDFTYMKITRTNIRVFVSDRNPAVVCDIGKSKPRKGKRFRLTSTVQSTLIAAGANCTDRLTKKKSVSDC